MTFFVICDTFGCDLQHVFEIICDMILVIFDIIKIIRIILNTFSIIIFFVIYDIC